MATVGWVKHSWQRSGLSLPVLLVMFKSALPPTVALCLLFNDRIAAYFGFIGYLTAILAVNPVLPQAQYVELMLQQVFGICLASATSILQLFCVIKARQHTSPPLPPPPVLPPGASPPPLPYNSSASAVSAVWLVVLVFLVCYVRSARPQLTNPCINFTVVVVVTSSVAPTFPTVSVALGFAKQLLVINLTGLALSIAVVLLVWPSTNRGAFERAVGDWQTCIERCLETRAAVMVTLLGDTEDALQEKARGDKASSVHESLIINAAASTQQLLAVVDKLDNDLRYAKREVSFGKLAADDLSHIQALLFGVVQPVIGLMSSGEYARKLLTTAGLESHRQLLADEHKEALQAHAILIAALRFSLGRLGLRPDNPERLVEGENMHVNGNSPATLEDQLQLWQTMRAERIKVWQTTFRSSTRNAAPEVDESLFFLVLEIQELLSAACAAAVRLAVFAERKVSGKTMARSRFILPRSSELRRSLHPVFSAMPTKSATERRRRDATSQRGSNSARTTGNSFGQYLHVFRSSHAGFAVRVACAVLCAQILAYLQNTQVWYNSHRGVWASITIATVTTRTVGQSFFGVASQIAGTLAGCLGSLIAWYIVDRKRPGVIVFYLILLTMAFYPSQRKPTLVPFTTITAITLTLLVGYEFESERLGKAIITANGQPYYPPYLLSWMDLLAILAGVGIASFWTLFPYPILESEQLPHKVSELIKMLASLHLQAHITIYSKIKGHGYHDSIDVEGLSPAQLDFIKALTEARQLLANSKYEIDISGRFPRDLYSSLLNDAEAIFRSISLVSYSTKVFNNLDTAAWNSTWMTELRRVASRNEDIELRTLSALSVCADCIADGRPLSPMVSVPETSSMLLAIKSSPMDLLHVRHAFDPGYTALAAIHGSALVVTDEIKELVRLTKELVGFEDFEGSFGRDGVEVTGNEV